MTRAQGSLKLIGGIFAAVGVVCGLLAAWLYAIQSDFEAEAVRAPGSVVRLEGGGKGRRPVVRFFAEAEDREVEITGQVSSSPPAYSVGEKVTVLYRPGHPEDGRIVGFLEQYFAITLLGAFFVIFGGVGAGLLVTHARSQPPPEA